MATTHNGLPDWQDDLYKRGFAQGKLAGIEEGKELGYELGYTDGFAESRNSTIKHGAAIVDKVIKDKGDEIYTQGLNDGLGCQESWFHLLQDFYKLKGGPDDEDPTM